MNMLTGRTLLLTLCVSVVPQAHCIVNSQETTISDEPSPSWSLQLQERRAHELYPGLNHATIRSVAWDPRKSAIIVCDVWDLHHSVEAVRRVNEIAPRINRLVNVARQQGAVIIHAPSDCMPVYVGHPARIRAEQAPRSASPPAQVAEWRHRIPSEVGGAYPVDQSDGGEDDHPSEHAMWAAQLKSLGRNPGTPWKSQSPLIDMDTRLDYITDRGDETWNILQSRGIDNVMLVGVHVNMCVLGRPFGLRQLVSSGKQVVLVRDLTDSMYNPARAPYISHFSGTDRIIEYIEQFVCQTITSDQILGGEPLRLSQDHRPRLAIVIAEDEYDTPRTLSAFAREDLEKDFKISLIYNSANRPHELIGLEALGDADALILSVRRRALPVEQVSALKSFVASGKPVLGIRTSSHAFTQRDESAPAERLFWPEFGQEVFGVVYEGHHDNSVTPVITRAPQGTLDSLFTSIPEGPFSGGGSLYRFRTLEPSAVVLLQGTIPNQQTQPVAWTYLRANGGRSFYTSLGHAKDFENPVFLQLLHNAVRWATNQPISARSDSSNQLAKRLESWRIVAAPMNEADSLAWQADLAHGPAWYRCFVSIDKDQGEQGLQLKVPANSQAWWNGTLLKAVDDSSSDIVNIPAAILTKGDLNQLTIRMEEQGRGKVMNVAPSLLEKNHSRPLEGNWQIKISGDEASAALALPAKFGASPDAIFD